MIPVHVPVIPCFAENMSKSISVQSILILFGGYSLGTLIIGEILELQYMEIIKHAEQFTEC